MKNNIEIALNAARPGMDTKERVAELMEIEGNMRGELLKSNFVYLEGKEGKDSIVRMEKKLKELGYPLLFKEIESFKWYKDAFCSIFMLSFREEFSWSDEDIFNLGRFSPQYSIIVKITLRYLISLKKAFNFAPNLWRRNVDYGILEPHEFNQKEKFMTFNLKDYALHPLVCIYIRGYLTSLFEQINGRNTIKVDELNCIFMGNPYHSYKVNWGFFPENNLCI